ncbi:hypothetical protein FOZ63_017421 [Perkinsus olseni]|uniref:Vesicle transport through interaction with t-SNAREs 1B n=2 Tax=Perkinsus olseni TaxID=32597 RepID=A0A7J6T3Y2_PEROL|nr:hypothetical protein FOZ63_017421 [Perkinsus olseni]
MAVDLPRHHHRLGREGKREADDGDSSRSAEQESLLKVSRKLEDGNQKLEDAKRTVLETEDVALSVMGDLRGQREVMSRTRDHFNDLDEQLTMARRAIQNMGRRVMLNKAVLVAVCLILLVAIFYTVHKKVMDRAGTVAGPPPPPSAP